ncbi:protein pitchfork isoform X2 [Alligator sinensis]|uniref:Protein pitchfork isoform X2 n=2 Tax=Alligator TaxID=8495 RepID=A0A1U7RWE5_ALLSI|nr:protein pitchfork isoform X1 [Alligator sinensis]XP_014376066.1 protein pitchfork isoform X2 [Alligator sinensis]
MTSHQSHAPTHPWQPCIHTAGSMIWEWELTDVQKRNSFGSCQDRNIFPLHYARDRLGNHLVPIRGEPWRGPGCYKSDEKNTMVYSLTRKPESNKGYVIGARTSLRFAPDSKSKHPDPGAYQSSWSKPRKFQPAYAPFSIKTPRFPKKILDRELFPGPGTYEADKQPHKKITWPMKFGSPDWSLVPVPEQRTLRTEFITDKEFRKHRNRLAYLSLYYS